MQKSPSRVRLIIVGMLLAVLLLALVVISSSYRGLLLYLELLGFFSLLILSAIGLVGYTKVWGERAFFFVFLFYLLNLLLIWYFFGKLYVVLFLLALGGFFLSLPRRAKKMPVPQKAVEPHSEVFDVPPAAEKKELRKAATSFSPGKYVASKFSNTYHEPKCEWAKKIHKERRVWFAAKEQAWEKGYKAHGCVV